MSTQPKRAASRWPPSTRAREIGPPRATARGVSTTLAIGDLAREFAISTRAIRFYEARGLIRPERRGLVRIFGPAERQRLALIVRAKNLGLTLEEIGEHLAIFDAAAAPDEPSVLKARADKQIALLETKRADLAFALRDLRRLSADLASLLRRARRTRS
jgi:DNA-binding transcriptional MerR regulator